MRTFIVVKAIREEIGLSQAEFATLLAVSPRTVQSCEQEWRKPSPFLEKHSLLLLMAHRNGARFGSRSCWKFNKCSQELRKDCIAFRSRQGHLCWLMTGTVCKGIRVKTWSDKIAMCRDCGFFSALLCGDVSIVSG